MMPIHVSWSSMIQNMLDNPKYCSKDSKRKCHKLSNGKRICGCQGGWSIFFATVNRMGADETKPMPKSKTKFNESKVIKWFITESKKFPILPKWIGLAQRIIDSPQFEESVKDFWSNKLKNYCKEHPEASLCQEVKQNDE